MAGDGPANPPAAGQLSWPREASAGLCKPMGAVPGLGPVQEQAEAELESLMEQWEQAAAQLEE